MIERSVACPLFLVVPFSLSRLDTDDLSLVLDLLDLTVVRAAGFPPGFFPNFTSTPFSGAPALTLYWCCNTDYGTNSEGKSQTAHCEAHGVSSHFKIFNAVLAASAELTACF